MNDGKRVHHDLQYENIPFSHMSIDLHLLKAPYQKKDKGRAKITAFRLRYLLSSNAPPPRNHFTGLIQNYKSDFQIIAYMSKSFFGRSCFKLSLTNCCPIFLCTLIFKNQIWCAILLLIKEWSWGQNFNFEMFQLLHASQYKPRLVYFFTPFFTAVYIVERSDNLCTKQGNSSIFEPRIHSF